MGGRTGDNPRAAGPVDKKIGARIRARRREIGMSQEALARELGITFQQVQKYEKGVNRVAAATLLELARALDVAVLTLLPHGGVEGKASLADDPELVEFVPLLAELSPEGRSALLHVARTFVKDANLTVARRRPK